VKKKAVDPIVVLRTSAGEIKIQLFAEKAPQTVDNFLRNYVRRGFYEGTIVHHADSAMVIAGGFGADLQPKETRAEIYNESANGLPNVAGSVAMARSPDVPHSATSQFFINLTDNEGFNYQQTDEGEAFGYCVFGKVLEGMEVAKAIASMPVSQQGDFPAVPNPLVTIQSVEQVQ
jgi:peptidyl-prolyl cis-trans isomerase A (cyclophilin A)